MFVCFQFLQLSSTFFANFTTATVFTFPSQSGVQDIWTVSSSSSAAYPFSPPRCLAALSTIAFLLPSPALVSFYAAYSCASAPTNQFGNVICVMYARSVHSSEEKTRHFSLDEGAYRDVLLALFILSCALLYRAYGSRLSIHSVVKCFQTVLLSSPVAYPCVTRAIITFIAGLRLTTTTSQFEYLIRVR